MEGKKFYTKVLEAVKGVNFEELEWVELWEEFWEAERSNWIKDEEKAWGRKREDTEEKPDIGDPFDDEDGLGELYDEKEREVLQIEPV